MFDYEVVGNIHIHSLHSDGTGSIPEIAAAAERAGLDFICINDHDYMAASAGFAEEGFYKNILVLIGQEIGKRYHHYLAFDLREMIRGDNLSPQEVIEGVNEQGGFGFLAHPFEKGMPFRDKSIAYTWNDLTVRGFTGISIWNFSSRWKERVRTALHALFFLIFKQQTLKGPSRKTIGFWDEICRSRRVAAIGGSDAHGSLFKWAGFHFRPFTYDYLLRTINIHILLSRALPKDFKEAKKEVYAAISEGRLFVAHDHLCPSKGFRFDFISDDGSDSFMGEERPFHPGNLVIGLPHEGEIRLIKDGRLKKKWQGMEARFRVEKRGVYRIETYRHLLLFGWRPWIFSNPIYLR